MSRVEKRFRTPQLVGFLQNFFISTGFGKVPHFETCVHIFDLRLIFLGEIPFLVPRVNRDEGSSHGDVGGLLWDTRYLFAYSF